MFADFLMFRITLVRMQICFRTRECQKLRCKCVGDMTKNCSDPTSACESWPRMISILLRWTTVLKICSKLKGKGGRAFLDLRSRVLVFLAI